MPVPSRASITAVHGYVPPDVLTNADLAHMVDTTDAWITERTGIKERHILKGEGLGTSHMGAQAVRGLLEKTGTHPSEIDLLICATVSPDQILPSTGCIIQAEIGAHNAAAMDVVAACSGFLYGVSLADSMIRTGQVKHAVVVGAEVLTQYVDYTDRQTCVLFGDGAGAAVLGAVEGNRGILASKIKSDGRYEEQLYSPGGGTRRKPTAETLAAGDHFFKMKGNELFKVAVRSMTEISRDVLEQAGQKADDVDLFIPHQANQRITEAVADRLNVDMSKVYLNIAVLVNTSAASIPIALDECVAAGRVKEGDLVLMASFGGGVTWGSVLMRW